MSHNSRHDGRDRKLRVERLEERAMLAAQPTLFDINLTPGDLDSNPLPMVKVGDAVYFAAEHEKLGSELWRTDGTAAGTVLVKDIRPGLYEGSRPWDLINVNGRLFFVANDGVSGYELWKSDGTESGTVRLRDINPGPASSFAQGDLTNSHAVVGNTLYFVANDGVSGKELWKSDGTVAGTVRVRDIRSGSESSSIDGLTVFNNQVNFSANDGVVGHELWRSDGTATGTGLVKDIHDQYWYASSYPRGLAVVNDRLWFVATGPNDFMGFGSEEIWVSDGTTAGTMRLRQFDPTIFNTSRLNGGGYTTVGEWIYFIATDYAVDGNKHDLWRTNGTVGGTSRVFDFPSGTIAPINLTEANGLLYFIRRGVNTSFIWRSDGTESGTVQVSTVPAQYSIYTPALLNVSGVIYFISRDEYAGTELWRTDGTASGTRRVKELRLGDNPVDVGGLTAFGDQIFFAGTDPHRGRELWKSDGTEAGTLRIADIQSGTASSVPGEFTNVGGAVFFTADDGIHGRELWRIGSPGDPPTLVKDIQIGSTGSSPASLFNFRGTLYFSANDGASGSELWKSDGTEAGTLRVKDIVGGSNGSSPGLFTPVGDILFFTATGFRSLWRTDGTPAGTVAVVNNNLSTVNNLTNVNGVLYFSASQAATGNELWRSDGSLAGTYIVKDRVGSSSFPTTFVNANGTLYYVADQGFNDIVLWASDGTTAGTAPVLPLVSTDVASRPEKLSVVGNTVFFTATNGQTGRELWKVSPAGSRSVRVKDISPGVFNSNPSELTNLNGLLYFRASDGQQGGELWKSDGTEAGTLQVKDIAEGYSSSSPSYLTIVNGLLAFRASNGSQPVRLWFSDGTQNGTVQVADLSPTDINYPRYLTSVGDQLYFAAYQKLTGNEVWVISAQLPLSGDYNRDEQVTDADHTFWAGNFNAATAPGLQADGNSNGVVDAADYTLWRDAYVPPAAAAPTIAIASAAVSALAAPSAEVSRAPRVSGGSSAPLRFLTGAAQGGMSGNGEARKDYAARLLMARDAAFADLGRNENPSPLAIHKSAIGKIASPKITDRGRNGPFGPGLSSPSGSGNLLGEWR